MRVATWNVNSVRQRIDLLLTWLRECQPDIVCLQEIKCLDEAFPRLEIEALGYNVVTHGQKTFNGVALLSKLKFDETKSGLAGDDEDAHARFLEGRHRRARALHLLGLPGRRLAEEPRPAHRPSAAVAAGQRPARQCRDRQLCAGLGEAVGPRASVGRSGSGGGVDLARSW